MSKSFFVTGTDTEIGKTLCASALLRKFSNHGLSTIGLKPIACGADDTPYGLRNDDALRLADAMSETIPYDQINPYCFAEPVAPHIAAQAANTSIDIAAVSKIYWDAMEQADVVIVEGVGGWEVPIDERLTTADLAAALTQRIILVVGLRLGCLNHALLTANAIRRAGLHLSGWIANSVSRNMKHREENVEYLRTHLNAPCLGVIPHLETRTGRQPHEFLAIAPLFDS